MKFILGVALSYRASSLLISLLPKKLIIVVFSSMISEVTDSPKV